MTLDILSIAFETVVALLLALMIFYCMRLNRRLDQMRARESEMLGLIEQFNTAAVRAETTVQTLKTVGADSERSLRAHVDRAQALRDDLMFMLDRGESIAAKVETARVAMAGNAVPSMETEVGGRPDIRPDIRVAAVNDHINRTGPNKPELNKNDPYKSSPAETGRASQSERELALAILSSKGGK